MLTFLQSIGYAGAVALTLGLLALTVWGLRRWLDWQSRRLRLQPQKAALTADGKKYAALAPETYARLFANLGLVFALGLVLVFFEMPTKGEAELLDLGKLNRSDDDMVYIPPTQQLPPPPPQPVLQNPNVVEVPDTQELIEEIAIDLSTETDEQAIVSTPEPIIAEITEPEVEEEHVDIIFEVVEDPATPKGGYEAFYAFVGERMKYPKRALDIGVSGRVFIQFVVCQDGALTDIKVVRGIGAGCDEEAVRVLKMAPNWNPAKQRGRPVKQRMIIPINFVLKKSRVHQ